MLFTDPRMHDYYPDWEGMARAGVALLRSRAVDNPTDPRLAALVGEMSLISPQFRQWWADRHVARPVPGTKTINHPELGQHPGTGRGWRRPPTQDSVRGTSTASKEGLPRERPALSQHASGSRFICTE